MSTRYVVSRNKFHEAYRLGPCISETFVLDGVELEKISSDEKEHLIGFKDLIGAANYEAWLARINTFRKLVAPSKNVEDVISVENVFFNRMQVTSSADENVVSSFGISMILNDLRGLADLFCDKSRLYKHGDDTYYPLLPYGGIVDWEPEHSPLTYKGKCHALVFNEGFGNTLVGNVASAGREISNVAGRSPASDEDPGASTMESGNAMSRGANSHDRVVPLIYNLFGHLEQASDCILNMPGFVPSHAHMMMFFNKDLSHPRPVQHRDPETGAVTYKIKAGSLEATTLEGEGRNLDKTDQGELIISEDDMYRISRMYFMSLQRTRFARLPSHGEEKHFVVSFPDEVVRDRIRLFGKVHIHYRVLLDKTSETDATSGRDITLEDMVRMGLRGKMQEFSERMKARE